jgi:hypothetical protein
MTQTETTLPLTHGGYLTTEHPLSSYGIPVLVAHDGRVLGPDDLYDTEDDIFHAAGLTEEAHPRRTAREWVSHYVNPHGDTHPLVSRFVG